VELAELQSPSMALGERLSAAQVIDDDGGNPRAHPRIDHGYSPFPIPRAFRAFEKDWIEERRGSTSASAQSHQVQDPRPAVKTESESID
jgi:hypothetical protein